MKIGEQPVVPLAPGQGAATSEKTGMTVQDLTKSLQRACSLEESGRVVVSEVQPGSQAANAEIRGKATLS